MTDNHMIDYQGTTMISRARCAYVPPHVLDQLSRRGVEAARLSTAASHRTRRARQERVRALGPGALAQGAAVAEAVTGGARTVYDCQSTWEQRVPPPVREESDAPVADDAVNTAYDLVGVVRTYVREVLARDSIDNAGKPLILNVHFGVDYMNAFWDGDEMTFGDGDGEVFTNFVRSLDVIAHELTHGITEHTAGLEYFSQSGALNESFSDIFGAAVTQWHLKQDAGTADWLVGDEIMGPTLFGEALRSMEAPGSAHQNPLMGADPQPAHMRDYYTGTDDNFGVHINSGIPNKAFHLTAMDIGTDDAARIWYRGLQRLWPTANFNHAADVLAASARLLVREGLVPPGAPQTVRSAFRAVGLPT